MLKISELSTDPIEAALSCLTHLLTLGPGNNTKIFELARSNHKFYRDFVIAKSIVERASSRIEDEEIRRLVVKCMAYGDGTTLTNFHAQVESAISAIVAYRVDNHFIDQKLIDDFDTAELEIEERQEIRVLMAETRQLVDRSSTLPEWARRRILLHVSKIENELHKEKSHFQAFLAAAADVSAVVKKVGKDAQPMADAIMKARTITERKVEGYAQIEMAEPPKRLPKPSTPSEAE